MRTLKSSRAYGRLTLPSGPSKSLKNPAENPTYGYQDDLQSPSDLLRAKAREYGATTEQLQRKWAEKYTFMKSRFSNQSKEWQLWYLEATVWSGLSGFIFYFLFFIFLCFGKFYRLVLTSLTVVKNQYPGREPKSEHHVKDNERTAPPLPGPGENFAYLPQEKVMEQMAKERDIRREFFQYLNMARHEAIAIHPRCICYARNFLADRLTWQKFCTLSYYQSLDLILISSS